MAPENNNILIILGPTCVGKSATAIKAAKDFDGEIINCDSMQVYRGFNIGTDKIPPQKRDGIPHHLIDVADPSSQFTAADFVHLSLEAVGDIQKRQRLPIITGGTGLYLKALLDGLFPGGKSRPDIRKHLEKTVKEKGLESLFERLKTVDPVYAEKIGANDRIRIIRALEVFQATKIPLSEHFVRTRSFVGDFFILKIGLKLERQVLYKKIEDRVDRMFESGLVDEVRDLLDKGVEEDSPPFRALGYKHALRYLYKELTLEDAVMMTKRDTRQYAKRQMTWFRKMEGIRWFFADEYNPLRDCLQQVFKK
ncbi:MAG: tRNA (adenosine(37)-N6)-dimethylallyltransferase MiaA [Candidatus Aminicenantes bacterium]